MKIWAAVLFFGLVSSGNIIASDSTDPLTIEFYGITGSTSREMRKQLNEFGPVDTDGSRHDGYTRWRVDWNYQLASNGKSCEVQAFETTLEVVMTLPKWNRPDHASKHLMEQWDTYATALRLHEDGHYSIAVAAAKEIQQQAAKRSSTSGCPALDQQLDATAKAVVSEYREKELEYDAKTEHGATQGALFPQ